ncbi:conserved Plasmodium protein, unknown function [Plasmodium relictum]|uniref:Uncharacterized protein n=1 Tax=Plasmodium relictum TaxID=85471 RepID=A0A1J1HB69_PLARL|nr:conserved Plasmodium protein, unknown function [Plasmodium relictum]CRH02676.1 conserved Plasmodium protein, unknown function [Plasmodium relictum]
MKKKHYFKNKNYIKNKSYLRKKKKYYTDQKFLRKYKKSINKNEKKVEITESDPIKNFFFTPIKEENIRKDESEKKEKKYKAICDLNSEKNNNLNKKNVEKDNSDENYNNSLNLKESDKHCTYNNEKQNEKKKIIIGNIMKTKKKGSTYSKEINYSLIKKREKEIYLREKEAALLENEKEKRKKKLIRIQKFKKLNKKTKKGQPVMSNIIKHLLEKI